MRLIDDASHAKDRSRRLAFDRATAIAEGEVSCNHWLVGRLKRFSPEDPQTGGSEPRSLFDWLDREVRARPGRSVISELAIGALGGLMAVGIRFTFPLAPDQLPTLPVVVALAIVTSFVGVWAGVATALVGGLLSWYFFFNPFSWSLANGAWISLLGFVVIATVIVTTAHLYRSAARHSHERDLARLRGHAENSELFAREMAHRLKNALAIVQSIAFQTIGTSSDDAIKFAGRLKTLADANDLLNEHVDVPSGNVRDVVDAALGPFVDRSDRFDVEIIEVSIPAQQVVGLALALHELATNAVKYGALSSASGRVSIEFLDAGDRFSMNWKETGGPEVRPPSQIGFGARLLRRSGIDTQLEFEPDGVRCVMGIRKS